MGTVLLSDLLSKARYLRDLLMANKFQAADMAAESLILDLMTLQMPQEPRTESEARDGGDCICERCQQDVATLEEGLCAACRAEAQELLEHKA